MHYFIGNLHDINTNRNAKTDWLNDPEDEVVAQSGHKAEEENIQGAEKDEAAKIDHDGHMSARLQVGHCYCQLKFQRTDGQPEAWDFCVAEKMR